LQKLPDNIASIDLKIEGAGPRTRCFYKIGNGEFIQLGQELESSFLSTATAGGFQGVTLGMFARLEPAIATNSSSQPNGQ
jgi:beta-xylosidase